MKEIVLKKKLLYLKGLNPFPKRMGDTEWRHTGGEFFRFKEVQVSQKAQKCTYFIVIQHFHVSGNAVHVSVCLDGSTFHAQCFKNVSEKTGLCIKYSVD